MKKWLMILLILVAFVAFPQGRRTRPKKKPPAPPKGAATKPKADDKKAQAKVQDTIPGAGGANKDEFVYNPRGRRDPFWNLLMGKSLKKGREAREGIGGLLIDELDLEGILLKEGEFISLFKGPDGRPYDVRVGDSVYDGEVIKIDSNTVVFRRILTVALGGTKEKIITKRLIPEEEEGRK